MNQDNSILILHWEKEQQKTKKQKNKEKIDDSCWKK